MSMSHRLASGCLFVFVALTLALVLNLTSFQNGSRELAPAPMAFLATSGEATHDQNAGGGLVILNTSVPQSSRVAMEVQRELTAFGYRPGSIDGALSVMTRAAIMAFEYDNGLPLTAAANDMQLQRLLLGTGRAAKTPFDNAGLPVSPEAKQIMQTVQQALKQVGYDPGLVDGAYTPETERAIRNLETDSNLPETGRISGRLVETLMVLASRNKLKVTSR